MMISIKYTRILLLLLSILILTACESKPQLTAEPTDAHITDEAGLSFRITWKEYSGRGEAIRKIVGSYDDLTAGSSPVSLLGGDEDMAALQTALETNFQTVYMLPYRLVKYFGAKGYLMNLTSAFKDVQNTFYTEVWDLGTADGVTYGIPWLGHSMCLIYNKDLLHEAGVDPGSIKSLDALVDAIMQVERETDAKGIGLVGADSNDLSWMVNQFVYGFGSALVSEDGESVAVNNEKAKAAILFYRDVLGKHAQPTWLDDTGVEVMTHFRSQEVAFEIQGIWGVTDIQKNSSPFDTGIIALKDIGLAAEVGPMMLSIPASMPEEVKEEAFRFIRYLISQEAQEKIMNGEYSPERDAYYPFRTPIRTDMAGSQIFKAHPEYLLFVEGFQNPSIDVPVPKWQAIKDDLYEPGLSQVMRGNMTADEFLQSIETEGNKILSGQ